MQYSQGREDDLCRRDRKTFCGLERCLVDRTTYAEGLLKPRCFSAGFFTLRGLLANGTRNRAIIWSAILFGLMHLNPWQFAPAFILGIVFAWWVIQTGSLWPAILGHALNNFLSVTFMHFEIPGFPVSEDLNVITHNPWWLNVCGPIVAALGLWWFYRVTKAKEAENGVPV